MRREILVTGLRDAGLRVFVPQGAYFVVADCSSLGFADDVTFCRHLVEHVGVAAIPCSAFFDAAVSAAAGDDGCRTLVRFAFCKREETLREGVKRLASARSRKPAAGAE